MCNILTRYTRTIYKGDKEQIPSRKREMKRPTQWRGHAPDRQTFRYPREEQQTTTDNLAAITYTRIHTMHEPTKTPTLCVFYRSYAMHFTFLLGRLKYARLINIYLVSLFIAI